MKGQKQITLYNVELQWKKFLKLYRSRSFKVTCFGSNRKPVCDFLLVNNTKHIRYPMSHRFQDIASIAQIFAVDRAASL